MRKTLYMGGLVATLCAVTLGFALHSPDSTEGSGPTTSVPAMKPSAEASMIVTDLNAGGDDAAVTSVADEPSVTEAAVPEEQVPFEVLAQRELAAQTIDAMLSGSVWGNEQRMTFYQNLSMLPPDRAEQAFRQLLVALNEGRMHVTTDGPPI